MELAIETLRSVILGLLMQSQNHTLHRHTVKNTTILATSGTSSINYMFRPIIGHRQDVFNLSSNYTIYVVYSGRGGDEIFFTIVSGIDSNLIGR